MPHNDMFKWIKKQIKQHGFAIINVFPSGDDCIRGWFHYTVGNHSLGLPELLAIGGDRRMSNPLSALAKIMRDRKSAFKDGELVSLGGKYPVKVINIDCPEVHDLYTCAVSNQIRYRKLLGSTDAGARPRRQIFRRSALRRAICIVPRP
jgi:hypothetical protein